MKTITEEQAQELANLLGLIICVCEESVVWYFDREPIVGDGGWDYDGGYFDHLPIRISSTRPWTEQIWRPTK